MRAAVATRAGFVDVDGIKTHYESYGDGPSTLLLIPPSPITYSRIWKGQIAFLSRHFRVVTFDGRGSGLSDRPTSEEELGHGHFVADAFAVLDELEIEKFVAVSHCHAGLWALLMLDSQPDRASGWIAISPGIPYLGTPNQKWLVVNETWDTEPTAPHAWEMANPYFWRHGGYEEWMEFFFSQTIPEAHSTKQREDAVGWATEVPVETMIAAESADVEVSEDEVFSMIDRLDVPMLVVHGTEDACQLVVRGRNLAIRTGAEYLELVGAGHIPQAREPVKVNYAIKEFASQIGARR